MCPKLHHYLNIKILLPFALLRRPSYVFTKSSFEVWVRGVFQLAYRDKGDYSLANSFFDRAKNELPSDKHKFGDASYVRLEKAINGITSNTYADVDILSRAYKRFGFVRYFDYESRFSRSK